MTDKLWEGVRIILTVVSHETFMKYKARDQGL